MYKCIYTCIIMYMHEHIQATSIMYMYNIINTQLHCTCIQAHTIIINYTITGRPGYSMFVS